MRRRSPDSLLSASGVLGLVVCRPARSAKRAGADFLGDRLHLAREPCPRSAKATSRGVAGRGARMFRLNPGRAGGQAADQVAVRIDMNMASTGMTIIVLAASTAPQSTASPPRRRKMPTDRVAFRSELSSTSAYRNSVPRCG